MKIEIHTLASDDDFGTSSRVFATEREAYEVLHQTIGEPVEFDEFMKDPWENVTRHSNYLDTYNIGEEIVEIPLRKVITDAVRLHPWAQELARRYREALRLCR